MPHFESLIYTQKVETKKGPMLAVILRTTSTAGHYTQQLVLYLMLFDQPSMYTCDQWDSLVGGYEGREVVLPEYWALSEATVLTAASIHCSLFLTRL